jgi:hypothetical protein
LKRKVDEKKAVKKRKNALLNLVLHFDALRAFIQLLEASPRPGHPTLKAAVKLLDQHVEDVSNEFVVPIII